MISRRVASYLARGACNQLRIFSKPSYCGVFGTSNLARFFSEEKETEERIIPEIEDNEQELQESGQDIETPRERAPRDRSERKSRNSGEPRGKADRTNSARGRSATPFTDMSNNEYFKLKAEEKSKALQEKNIQKLKLEIKKANQARSKAAIAFNPNIPDVEVIERKSSHYTPENQKRVEKFWQDQSKFRQEKIDRIKNEILSHREEVKEYYTIVGNDISLPPKYRAPSAENVKTVTDEDIVKIAQSVAWREEPPTKWEPRELDTVVFTAQNVNYTKAYDHEDKFIRSDNQGSMVYNPQSCRKGPNKRVPINRNTITRVQRWGKKA